MNQLKAQGKSFTWGSEQQSSFEKLKVAIATTPILVVVDPRKPFVVETDPSANPVGAKRELYAIVHALKKWRHYLYGAMFDVLFYQESIKWFTG